MEVYCFGCGVDLTNKATDRRKLSGRVFDVWRTFLYKKRPEADAFTTVNKFYPGRMCRKCFNAYERLAKLHVEASDALDKAFEKNPCN